MYHTLKWRKLAKKLKREANYRCAACNKIGSLRDLNVHHKIPVKDGGDFFNESNLEVLCISCHAAKHKKPVSKNYQEWINFRDELRK